MSFGFPKMILNVQLLGELESHWTMLEIVFPPRKKPAPCLGPVLKDVRQRFWDFDEFSLAEACFLFIDGIVLYVYQSKNDSQIGWLFFFPETSSTETLKCSHLKPFHSTCRGNLDPQGCGHSTCWRVRCEFFCDPTNVLEDEDGKSWSHIWVKDCLRAQPTQLRIAVSQAGGVLRSLSGVLVDSHDLPEILLIMACQVLKIGPARFDELFMI